MDMPKEKQQRPEATDRRANPERFGGVNIGLGRYEDTTQQAGDAGNSLAGKSHGNEVEYSSPKANRQGPQKYLFV